MNTFLINSFQKERQEFENTTQRLYDTHHFPDDVIEIRNVRYGTDNLPEHRMDVYRPADTQRIYPVIINVHGGGLVMGSKEFNRFFCAEMCKLGYVVFSIEYRLIPEVQVKDMCAASPNKFLHWEKINAVQSFLICFSFSMCQINIHELAYAQYVNHLGHVVVFRNLLASF